MLFIDYSFWGCAGVVDCSAFRISAAGDNFAEGSLRC
jgi:hypothetical protein